jgi:small-conductance mechanosensitive channel
MTIPPELASLLHRWPGTAALAVVAALAAYLVLAFVVTPLVRRLAAPHLVARTLLVSAGEAARMVLTLFAAQAVLEFAPDTLPAIAAARRVVQIAMMLAMIWFGVRVVGGVAATVIALHPVDVQDNLHARRIVTQTRVLSRTASVFVIVVGAALVLMTFPGVRQVGTSLLASAGVAGIVVGFAARPVLANLIAGLQIALTQPIRVDDVLVVAGEWGRVEEIGGTFVVVRLWDDRRLVVPLQWFIENPFENWTRTTSALTGTVMLWVDYRMPMAPLREELKRLVDDDPRWDRRLALLQVTDANERAMQVRILVTAADSGRAFDLRCHVREGMFAYLQREHAQFLPRIRAEVPDAAALEASGRPPARTAGAASRAMPTGDDMG